MSNEGSSFNYICTSCHTPALKKLTLLKRLSGALFATVIQVVIWGVVTALLYMLFKTLGLMIGLGVGLLILFFSKGGNYSQKCEKCGKETIIPIDTPQGMKIMRELGYIEE